MTAIHFIKWVPAALLVLSGPAPSAHAQAAAGPAATAQQTAAQTAATQKAAAAPAASRMSEKLHGNALASFRQGRFSEAYGRLIRLADAGHVPSAEMALWMYLHGTTVFGTDWDSTPEQLKAWAQAAGQPVQAMVPTVYPRTLVAVSTHTAPRKP